jgi:hypothetical protein
VHGTVWDTIHRLARRGSVNLTPDRPQYVTLWPGPVPCGAVLLGLDGGEDVGTDLRDIT